MNSFILREQKSRVRETSNPREYHNQPLHSLHVTVWCGFTTSFFLGTFFFKELCPLFGRKTCTVTAKLCLSLLRGHVVPSLQERHALLVVAFMQDGAPPHITRDVKTFLLESFTKDRVISHSCKIQWPSRSPS